MQPGSQASPRPGRVARRRAATRDRIVAAAARRFAEDGPEAVRLDEVADAADVARGTLYSHFRTKDDLLCAIIEPVLEIASRRVSGLARLGPAEAVDALLGLYLDLWRAHPDALRIADKAHDIPVGGVGALHARFLKGVMRVFERANRSGALRAGDAALAAHLLRRLAVPLLELYAAHPGRDRLFRESLEAILLKPE